MRPQHTTIDDLIHGLKIFGCESKARTYEAELDYFLEHGKLMPDAQYTRLTFNWRDEIICVPKVETKTPSA